MNIITIHSTHERCGISEYGKQLDAAFSRAGVTPEALTFDSAPARTVSCKEGDVVFVHFEPLLVPKGGFLGVLQEARSHGARVVLCCHYYDPSVFSTMGMKVIDRFVLHRHYSSATHPKFIEIPLGCPVYEPGMSQSVIRANLQFPRDAFILTTVGFLASWKKTPEVIDALLEQIEGRQLLFQVLMPRPFNGDGEAAENETRDILRKHGTKATHVLFSTEFRPEKDLLDRVYASDLGFLFHGQDTGSVSAATKQFVSARTPLVTTASTHASDLLGGIHRVDSFDPYRFATEVLKVADNRDKCARLEDAMEGEYERINMNAVAERYLTLFRSLL